MLDCINDRHAEAGELRRGVMLDRAINPQLSPYPLIFIVEDGMPKQLVLAYRLVREP